MPLTPPTGGGTPFNPHSPGPIGDVTPGTGAFTGLTIAPVSQPSSIVMSGINMLEFYGAGFGDQPLNIRAPKGISLLSDLAQIVLGTSPTSSVTLTRPGSGVLAQRNGTNGQEYQVYETDDGLGNYGRAVMRATAGGPYVVGAEAAGGGTLRSLNLVGNQVKANNFLVSQIIVQGSAGISTTVSAGASSTINITASGAIAGDVAIIDCAALLSGVGWTGTGGLFFLATIVSPNTLSIVVFNTDLINAYSITGSVNYLIEGVR
jgi:hypothetical protein